ncbi:MAG: hypothetical protein SOZ34_10885 [Clostridia bacterium]|nr:hypothetical protein [Clostridia bacterium]
MENLSQNQYNYFFGGINTMHSPHKHTNRCFPFTVVVHVNEGQYLCYYKDKIIVANSGETLVVPEYVLHDIEMKEYGYLSWAHICAHINGNDILEGYDSPFIIGSAFSNYFKTFLNALNNTKIESLSLQALK